MPTVSHKIRLYPTKEQEQYLVKACGVSRFAYNWALNRWKELYELGGKPGEMSLRRELNVIKKTEFPWMSEVTKCAPQEAIRNLGKAFKKFFAGKAKYPKPHKKFRKDSFYISNDQVTCRHAINSWTVRLPNLPKPISMAEKLRFHGRILSATISRRASFWFVSFIQASCVEA